MINDNLVLPRPKLTQEVLHIGPEEECQQIVDKERERECNRSTGDIDVQILCVRYVGQKTYTSKDITKNNGKRNTGHLA